MGLLDKHLGYRAPLDGIRAAGADPSNVRFDAIDKYSVKAEGNAAGASAAVLAELAGLIAAGELEVPIAAQMGHRHRRLAVRPARSPATRRWSRRWPNSASRRRSSPPATRPTWAASPASWAAAT
jgi:hypothetical protein